MWTWKTFQVLIAYSIVSSFHAPGDDLELVELQSEDASRVLDEGAHAQGARGCPGVKGGGQVPNLEISQGLLRAVGFKKDLLHIDIMFYGILHSFIGRYGCHYYY